MLATSTSGKQSFYSRLQYQRLENFFPFIKISCTSCGEEEDSDSSMPQHGYGQSEIEPKTQSDKAKPTDTFQQKKQTTKSQKAARAAKSRISDSSVPQRGYGLSGGTVLEKLYGKNEKGKDKAMANNPYYALAPPESGRLDTSTHSSNYHTAGSGGSPVYYDNTNDFPPLENPYDPESSQDPGLKPSSKPSSQDQEVKPSSQDSASGTKHAVDPAQQILEDKTFEQALMSASNMWITPPTVSPRRRKPKPKISDPWSLSYPPRFLADIGLYSLFLVINFTEFFDGTVDLPAILKAMDPYIHAGHNVCWLVPLDWTLSPCNDMKDMKDTGITSPTYFKKQPKSNAFGIRVITSYMTKQRFQEALHGWDRITRREPHISIYQPQVHPPPDFKFRHYCDLEDYDRAGWLFLSSRKTSNLELQSIIILELFKIHPEWRWFNDPIRCVHDTVSEVIDLTTRTSNTIPRSARCIWIAAHPDIPIGVLQSFLRNLFSREILNRPLCRPLLFIPNNFTEAGFIDFWNKFVSLQQQYYDYAETGAWQNSRRDPYESLRHNTNQLVRSTRQWAVIMQDKTGYHYCASFDRHNSTPWIPTGVIRQHKLQTQHFHELQFDPNLLSYLGYQKDPFALQPTGSSAAHLVIATDIYREDKTYKNTIAQQALAYAQRNRLILPFLRQILPAEDDADASRKRQRTETKEK
jgi:hypothetical protein